MSFKVGDIISFIDVKEFAKILAVHGTTLTIEDEFGFERICSINEVVVVTEDKYDNIEVYPKHEEETTKKKRAKKRVKQVPVIDLHMENLVGSHSHMSNHEIVLFQLRYFRDKLEEIQRQGIKEFLIVHGIGTGKLKQEVRYILNEYPNLEYMDDHVGGYGVGATRVFI